MSRRTYSSDEKTAALDVYRTDGPTAAETATGIPKATIASWARRTGVQTECIPRTAAAVAAAALTMEQRKQALAAALMDDIERLRLQLWSVCTERKAMAVSDGAERGSHIEIVDIEHEQPTFGDQKAIMTSLAIAVDKVQILTGEATSRTEVLGVAERAPAEERVAKLIELRSAS